VDAKSTKPSRSLPPRAAAASRVVADALLASSRRIFLGEVHAGFLPRRPCSPWRRHAHDAGVPE
jgi:hypothetical protein